MEFRSLSLFSGRLGASDPQALSKALGPVPLPLARDLQVREGSRPDPSTRLRRFELNARRPELVQARNRAEVQAIAKKLASKVERPLYEGWGEGWQGLAALAQVKEGGATEDQLRQVAGAASELLGQLNTATGSKGLVQQDPLAQDLKEALSALFRPGTEGRKSLADVGFTLDEQGEPVVDQAKLKAALAPLEGNEPPTAEQVLSSNVFTLASAGAKAILDALNQAPLEERLAEQNVKARADLARLEVRQHHLLIFDAFVSHQRTVQKAQGEQLARQKEGLDAGPKAKGTEGPPAHPWGQAKGSEAKGPTGVASLGQAGPGQALT